MPQQPEKTVPPPKPSLLQRLFGSSELTPEIQQGIDIAKRENPNLANVQPYGPISRLLLNKAQGYTSPMQTIYLNPTQLEGMNPQDVADTVLHEQTHVNQMKARGSNPLMELYSEMKGSNLPYGQRPDEMAAFQAEKERRARMNRMQTAVPSFTNPGEYYVPMDTRLPPANPVKKNK